MKWAGRNGLIRRMALGLMGCALALVLLSPAASAQEKIRVVAGVSWPGYGFFEIAERENLAPGQDFEVDILNDPLVGFSMLAAGQYDVFITTVEYLPIGVEQGMPFKNVAYMNISYGTDQVILAPGIEPQDLPGNRLAAPLAYLGHLMTGMWLKLQGIDPDAVKWVDLISEESTGAMLAGDLAAAHMYEPWSTQVLENLEGSRVVADSAEPVYLETGMFADAMFMTDDFIQNHRDTALEVLKAHWAAVEWWKKHPVEANDIFAEYLQWPVEDIVYVMGKDGTGLDGTLYPYDFLESARFCGVAPGEPPFNQRNGHFYYTFNLSNDLWMELGLMQSKVPAARGIDCSLMRELYETGYAGKADPHY